MPLLLRFLLHHAAVGFAIAAAAAGVLSWLDVAGPGGLVATSESGLLAVFLLTVFGGLTLGSVQMGVAVTTLGGGDSDGSGGRRRGALARWLAPPSPAGRQDIRAIHGPPAYSAPGGEPGRGAAGCTGSGAAWPDGCPVPGARDPGGAA